MWPERLSRWLGKAPAPPKRLLALGDSYTIGEALPADGRWPMQLAKRLRGLGVALEPTVIATTGWTTDELLAALDADPPGQDFDLVSLSIGVNNQYRGRAVAEYERDLSILLKRALKHAGGERKRVFMLSIPDWGDTPFAEKSGRDVMQIGREIDAFNAAAKRLCEQQRIAWCDITDLTRTFAHECAEDGLHPSATMYSRWVVRVLGIAPVRALKGG